MPEIPEMEIYKNYLSQWVAGKAIAKAYVLRPQSVNLAEGDFIRQVTGKYIRDICRVGKFLVFQLDDRNYLLTHMMLDGRIYFLPEEIAKDIALDLSDARALKKQAPGLPGKPSVILELFDGSILFFCVLTLGYLHFLPQDELNRRLAEVGRDPLDPSFTAAGFAALLGGRRGMIKPWLMNQKNLAGIGNAYSNETLFAAGILPTRQITALTAEDKSRLYASLVRILKEAVELGGYIEEPFFPWDKTSGGYIPHFKVYDREGQNCYTCNSVIQKEEVGGREAYFCPRCQV